MGGTTTEVEDRGGYRVVIFTYDTSNDELWDQDEITEEFIHPDDLDKVTGRINSNRCQHDPHNEIKAKGPDDKHEGSYCVYCGALLYAG